MPKIFPDEPTFPPYVPTVGNAVRASAERFDESEFVVTPDSRLSFAALDRRSRNLAARLVASGVAKGSRVGLLFPNGTEWVVAWAAAARIGAVVVPVSTFYKPFELGRFLRHADVQHLLLVPSFVNHDYVERLETVIPELADRTDSHLLLPSFPQLRSVRFWGESPRAWATGGVGDDLDAAPDATIAAVAASMEEDVFPGDPMLLMYTSGSTADPKGVLHSHGALTRHAYQLAALSQLDQTYRLWTPMPFFWIGGFHTMMFRSMVAGATLVTQDHFEPGAALKLLERERVTHVLAWPATSKGMLDHPDYATTDLSAVRGGTLVTAVPPECRPSDPTLYPLSLGMTETCGPHSYYGKHEEIHGVPPEYRGTFGQTVPGVEVRIVDPETNQPLPEGEEGEVVVRGYTLMLGFQKRERQESFDADGWYHTADRGHYRDGWLFFTGRQSDMIKTGGSNVAPAEVELCMMSFPELMRAFVLGVGDQVKGQTVVALVVPWTTESGPAPVDEADIQRRLKDMVSSYKVPKRVFVIGEGHVPWLASQKVDRRALTALAEKLVAENGGL